MATLIAHYTRDRCIGRCDARCYNAKGNHCHCICGGFNHGVGRNEAAARTLDQLDEIRLRCLPDPPTGAGDHLIIPLAVRQRPLPLPAA
jgi:hypothetical protein